jgi:hypothetical protein
MKPHSTDHADVRVEQRYALTREDLLQIAQDVELKRPNVRFICAETLSKTIYRVLYQYRWVHIVYDRCSKTVVTVLPGFLSPAYVRSRNCENRITSKREVDFQIPEEWEDDND